MPDGERRSARGAIHPWSAGTTSEYFTRLLQGLAERDGLLHGHRRGTGCRPHVRKAVLHGVDEQVHVTYRNRYSRQRSYYAEFEGVIPFLERRAAQTDSDFAREKYEGYMREVPCPVVRRHPAQAGDPGRHRRARPSSAGKNIAELSAMSIKDAAAFFPGLVLVRARPDDRRAGAQGGRRPARVPAGRRARLPVARTGRRRRCPAARRSGSGWPPRSAPAWSACCTCSTSRRSGCTSGTTTG